MTEKSEDQVWVCCQYYKCWHTNSDGKQQRHYDHDDYICNGTMIPYIPHSKYLALKSDLATAVEALEEIINIDELCTKGAYVIAPRPEEIAKEALGKIGGGK